MQVGGYLFRVLCINFDILNIFNYINYDVVGLHQDTLNYCCFFTTSPLRGLALERDKPYPLDYRASGSLLFKANYSSKSKIEKECFAQRTK